MRNILLLAAILVVCTVAAHAQNPNCALTSGLTSVASELNGNTFTWTIMNNTGLNDGNTDWDVLVWEVQPVGLPDPIQVTAPSGWIWTTNGHSKFQIKDQNRKYKSTAAITPGNSLKFQYTVDSTELSNIDLSSISFLTHVAAVEPTPTAKVGKLEWAPTTVDGNPSWHDQASTPEPEAILPFFLACSAVASIIKSGRRRRLPDR
ncbi:MAG: hypothetical protein ABFD46_01865 [Armatimonadota bacterium]